MTAKDIMTQTVLTARETTSIQDICRTLAERRIGGLPIVDRDGKLVGILSQDDIIFRSRGRDRDDRGRARDMAELMRGGFVTFADSGIEARTARDIMTTPVLSVREDTPVQDICRMFWDKRVHRLPVVDDANRLLGIISSMDVCRAVADGRLRA